MANSEVCNALYYMSISLLELHLKSDNPASSASDLEARHSASFMPPFANPGAGQAATSKKRKSEGWHDEQPLKRTVNDGRVSTSFGGHRSYWLCQYRAPQYKKHKTWDGDGILEVLGTRGIFYGLDSKKYLISSPCAPPSLTRPDSQRAPSKSPTRLLQVFR